MKPGALTADAQATLLLCSHLAMPKGSAAGDLRPLAPTEWNDLAQALVGVKLRPGALLDMDTATARAKLGASEEQANRITRLLGRGAQLAVEVERLGSLGIWALTRADEAYPQRLKDRLGVAAPPVLFGAGDQGLLSRGFLAVVGSRDVDESGQGFATRMGEACAQSGLVLVSGGAKGVDRISMTGCLKAGGTAIGVLADSLERTIREPETRSALAGARLVLLSAVHPKAPFVVANAMARNKHIYCLARYGLVVASSLEKGGTRAGALEVLKHRWVPLFVRAGEAAPAGNQDLIKRGALSFPADSPGEALEQWMAERAGLWSGPSASARKALAGASPAGAIATAAEDDLFPVVWPHIARRMSRWTSLEELARNLCVDPGQLGVWIDRALKQGLIPAADVAGKRVVGGSPAASEQIRFEVY